MTIPAADHPLWALLRQAIPLAVLGLMLAFNYNSVDSRDIVTLLVVAASGGLTESAGKLLKPKEATNGQDQKPTEA